MMSAMIAKPPILTTLAVSVCDGCPSRSAAALFCRRHIPLCPYSLSLLHSVPRDG